MKAEVELEQRPARRSPSTTGWEVLGVLLTTSGLFLTGFYPTHSFAHGCGIVAFAVGIVLRLYRSHYLLASPVRAARRPLDLSMGRKCRLACPQARYSLVLALMPASLGIISVCISA